MISAILRLSPRMVRYHLRRLIRNRLCRNFGDFYATWILRGTAVVPNLRLDEINERQRDLAQIVSSYYVGYAKQLDELVAGRVTLLGKSVDFLAPQQFDYHRTIPEEVDLHLWRMKFCHLGFVSAALQRGTPADFELIEAAVMKFQQSLSFKRKDIFSSVWFPYSASHRILAITSALVSTAQSTQAPKEVVDQLKSVLRLDVAFVFANLEHELKNNHLERNVAALCFYYSCCAPPTELQRRRIEIAVEEVLSECILEDGMQIERSPMYQALTVMSLCIFAEAEFLRSDLREKAARLRPVAIEAWRLMTHPDGEIALFNDSWIGEVPRLDAVFAQVEAASSGVLPQAGFARLENEDICVLFDAGAIGPSWNPGHGHADFLSICVDLCGIRFIVDPGTYQYSSGERRTYDRAAASHNGPAYPGVEPVEFVGCFKVGQLASATISCYETTGSGGIMSGELPHLAGMVTRKVELNASTVSVSDVWQSTIQPGVTRLLVGEDWAMVRSTSTEVVFSAGGQFVKIQMQEGQIAKVSPGSYSQRYLEDKIATALELKPSGTQMCQVLSWTISLSHPE